MKTYKTIKGLKNALKKVLGEESIADPKSGKMTKGWMSVPLKGKKGLRVFMIDATGYPTKVTDTCSDWAVTLESGYGGEVNDVGMFGYTVECVDITLEVSK